ncbi:MAG: DegT/DnrJ/EryC1/StrS family aminotransferase, partial [Bacteroidales bacterium]|nr:DegT/DnrJ/EryC1/StrS family aminotransferase [Bacteroidales bacterium]
MRPIVMVDLQQQHEAIKTEIDQAIQRVIQSSQFIKGPEVINFEGDLAPFLATPYVISCANGP